MTDTQTDPMPLKKVILTAVAWLAFIIIANSYVLQQHEMLAAYLPLAGVLLAKVAFIFAGALVVMGVLRAPKISGPSVSFALLWIILVVAGHYLAVVEQMNAEEILAAMNLDQGWKSLLLVSLIYALLIGVPFVPGLELGVAIIMLFRVEGSVAVYLSTVAGLFLAFAVGRLVPGLFHNARFEERRAHMLEKLGPRFMRYRYLVLAVLLNVPGNSVIGGGGGIAMACGVARQYSWGGFLLTVLVATAPIPIMLWFGVLSLDQLFT